MQLTRLSRWLLYLGGDALGRFVLQVGSTIVFARLLEEEAFGRSALTIAWIQVLAILVCAPFEEGLVQRRLVRKAHFNACLAAAMTLTGVFVVVLTALVVFVPRGTGHWAQIAVPLLVFSGILFAEGPVAIYTAAARRTRRFRLIASGNILGLTLGTGTGLWLAVEGAGLWSLLAVRMVARFVLAGWLGWRLRIRFVPGWSWRRLSELRHFAGWHTADRGLTVLSDAVFQSLVTGWLGAAANGYLNMATRIIEPIRGMTGSASHNIAMTQFSRLQSARDELRSAMGQAVALTSLILVPVFLGLAATSDTLVQILAGPDWAPAVSIAMLFGLATAIQAPFEFVHTAAAARGRADLGFYTSVFNLIVLVLAIWSLSGWGVVAIGLARLAYYLADTACALLIARGLFGARLSDLGRGLAPALLCGTVMAGMTAWLPAALPPGLPWVAVLAAQVAFGAGVFGGMIVVLARAQVRTAVATLINRR
ncbi:MAG: oligosaccharide flippase family protein [Pseudomonadota bacterium]|nr:oligosaccharide flippase family protein [Pseudomonadota bacterium]